MTEDNWRRNTAACGSAIFLLTAITTCALAQQPSSSAPTNPDALYREFLEPPSSAKPRVWWHWMNGNITKEGIRLDLEWMSRVGIGGFQNFDAALLTPQVVPKRLIYMTPEWIDALSYTVDLAEQHGLEMAIAASPGWSETGGPWVQPEQAMKKLVWSETQIEGGKRFAGKLREPPNTTGPFQDVPQAATITTHPKPGVKYYADAAVIAYPISGRDEPVPVVSESVGGAPIDAGVLRDGALTNSVKVKFGTTAAPGCLVYDYRRPATIASLLLGLPIGSDFFRSPLATPVLEASDDGKSFRKVADVPSGVIAQHTISFAPVSARYFRVCFAPPPPPFTDLLDATAPGANMLGLFNAGKRAASIEVNELQLFATPRVHHAEEKAGFAHASNYYAIPTAAVDAALAVPTAKVIDLTREMKPDGTLAWTPPKGRWKVLRFGYSLTGKENHPATPEATGLEVDKLDREHVKAYLDTYLGNYERAVGAQRVGAKGIRALLVDSIEVGSQNWTETLPAEFRRRRGYELAPWMPALVGVIVGSAEQTDNFLYDFRRTLGELLADNHYGQVAQTAKARGLIQYGEALEQGRPTLGDDMEMRRHASIPMAAMWTYSPKVGAPTPPRFADIRGAASVAHIYGQNLVAAESLTSAFAPWAHSPRDLKPMIDMEFVLGINRPVIHTSVHQPLADRTPGLTLAIFGQFFTRNESWAEQAGPWMTYLSRTSHMLQQGRFAADVAYFYGEEAPLTALYREQPTLDAPTGHGFDFVNADVVLNRLQVDDGDLVTTTGMRYRVLYLGGTSERMTLPVLRRIEQLVAQGATVAGKGPIATPSLADDAQEFAATADRLWSGGSKTKGKVIAARDANDALAQLGVMRDFDYVKPQPDSDIMFLHRRLDDGEAYFLTNRKSREEMIQADFRVTGKRPEIWRADTGRKQPVSYRIESGTTSVMLRFAPHDAYFVVFRETPTIDRAVLSPTSVTPLTTLTGNWNVTFQPGRGGPADARKLAAGSWSDNPDPAVRYFSGTASYSRELSVPAAWTAGSGRLMLDLGEVHELAEVLVNGRSLGIVWHPPYRVDITDAVRRGANRIEAHVTNLWVNRLIGDAQPNVKEKITFTTFPPYLPDAPLRPSGLIGPVRLEHVDSPAASAQSAQR